MSTSKIIPRFAPGATLLRQHHGFAGAIPGETYVVAETPQGAAPHNNGVFLVGKGDQLYAAEYFLEVKPAPAPVDRVAELASAFLVANKDKTLAAVVRDAKRSGFLPEEISAAFAKYVSA